jgi:3-oxoacyl-[acyl-carrier-protein] synthase II
MATNSSDRRVAVTGLGVVAPIGNDVGTFWKNLISGRCGIEKIATFDASPYDTQIAGEVKNFDPAPAFPSPKEVRRADRFSQFGVHAAWQALRDSGLDLPRENRDEIGVIIGSGIGGLQTTAEQHQVLLNRGPDRLSPFMIPMLISNMASGLVSMFFDLRGPNFATCSACATANHAIGEAWRAVKMGDAQVMFAGGAEATIVPIGIGGFCAMKAMSTRNDDPQHASRPFDKERDGFVMGEGAGVVVLEELEHARRRGAKIYAEYLGCGLSGDAYHITAPAEDGGGAERAMRAALKRARLNPEDIDYINAHGTSTPLGDEIELKAVKRVFGDWAYKLSMSSTKSAIGHLLGAAGAVEAIFSILAIRDQIVPPTLNLDNPSEGCDIDLVAKQAKQRKVRAVLSNSFGFGGTNASLIFTGPP